MLSLLIILAALAVFLVIYGLATRLRVSAFLGLLLLILSVCLAYALTHAPVLVYSV